MSYSPAKVWTYQPTEQDAFVSINRPTAGARFEQSLPKGQHALQLYSLATPNGIKVSLMLEELLELGIADADYDAWLISIRQGEQFGSGFTAINPNSKIPALLDYSVEPPQRVFESGSILLYLAEKFQQFLPTTLAGRTEVCNWLFWQMGAAPFVGGGFGHFYHYAPEKLAYPIDRYTMETKRQLSVLELQLSQNPWIAGPDYSIADIACWPWYGQLVLGQLYDAAEFLSVHEYPHVRAWAERIAKRPAAQRAMRVNRNWGEQSSQLPERHSRADFD